MTADPNADPRSSQEREAAERVAEAHRILNGLRNEFQKHPDLEEAIAKLEMALSILTTNTAGML